MTVSNNWFALKATSFLIVVLAMLFAPNLGAEATVVCDLRIGDNSGSAPLKGSLAEASVNADESVSSAPSEAVGLKRQQFQQRLIAALITVVSVIIFLLFLLIRMGNGRPPQQEPYWKNHLPPAKDPTIEHIDAVIREHLKRHQHR